MIQTTALRPAQARTVEVAMELFANHGVSGTSLQMIADALGVTKAAIYHQFRTKEDIVAAVVRGPMTELEAALDAAERASSRRVAVELLLDRFIAITVEHRQSLRNLRGDPVMAQFLAEHEELRSLGDRHRRLLMGDDDSDLAKVRTAMLTSAIPEAAADPLVADLDDETLHRHLMDLARQLLELSPND